MMDFQYVFSTTPLTLRLGYVRLDIMNQLIQKGFCTKLIFERERRVGLRVTIFKIRALCLRDHVTTRCGTLALRAVVSPVFSRVLV